MSAVLALLRQHRPYFIDLFSGYRGPVTSPVTGLSAGLPLALLPPAPLARRACQPIGGRRLRGVRGVLFAKRQLPLQIGDLLFFLSDSPLVLRDSFRLLGELAAQLANLAAQALVFVK